MEVKLVPLEKYELIIDGQSIGEFTKISSWEGMSKFICNNGEVIVDEGESTFSSIFDRMFDKADKSICPVMKISSGLIPVIESKTKTSEEN